MKFIRRKCCADGVALDSGGDELLCLPPMLFIHLMGFDFSTPLWSELLHITHIRSNSLNRQRALSIIQSLFYFPPFSIMIPSSPHIHGNSAFMFFFLVVEFPLFPHVTRQSTAFRWEKKSIHCVNIVLNDELEILCSLAYVNCTQRKASTFKAAGEAVTMKITFGSAKSRPAVSDTCEIFDFLHLPS